MDIKLSIVIISFNRPSYLLRLIKFLISYKFPIKIIILDSSEKDIENDQLINIIKKSNIIIKRFPSNTLLAEKLFRGLKYVNTEYSVLCAEDDFLFPTSLLKCVEFLDCNQDYSSAHGLYFNHSSYEHTIQKGFDFTPLFNNGCSNQEDKATDRIIHYTTNKSKYYPIYAVHRSHDLKFIWQQTSIYANDWNLNEYFPCCLSFILGKMKILPILYSSREINFYIWQTTENIKLHLSNEKILKASDGLVKFLSKHDDISLEGSDKIFINFFNERKKVLFKKINRIKTDASKKLYIRKLIIKPIKLIRKIFRNSLKLIGLNYLIRYSINYNINLSDLKILELSILSNKTRTDEMEHTRKTY